MKIGELKSLGHNVADSLASGIGFMIGVYAMDVFGEATSSADGYIAVDFLRGTCLGNEGSDSLRRAVALYRDALPDMCEKHGLTLSAIAALQARYGVDKVYGPHFTVIVEDTNGRRSSDRYIGVPGKRLRVRP